MKQLISSLLLASLISASPALAQISEANREAFAEQARERAEAIAERLDLTEEQKPEVEAILREAGEKRLAIMKSYGFEEGSRPNLRMRQKRDLRNELRALTENTSSKLAGVLTEDQMAEYAKIQEEQREEMRQKLQER